MISNEKCIGKIICSKIPVEWIRFNMYYEQDKYQKIPMLVFRVQKSCPEVLLAALISCVDKFEGKMKWKVFRDPYTRKENYLLSISELEDLYTQCYLSKIKYNQIDFFGAERYKNFCDSAIQDIPMLAKYIEENF